MKEIPFEEAIRLERPVFIDVRAPIEFGRDSIPGSVNIPVFDDEERALVGTMYRTQGKLPAMLKGSEIAGAKLHTLLARFLEYSGRDVVVTCFRGGMRSTTIASLLSSVGMEVYKLRDGYKGYRRYVSSRLASLTLPCRLFVLHGLTGTGKTDIIRRIPEGIDLEAMAGHRSSVFGALGLVQHTQKMFESLLLQRIDGLAGSRYAVVEGESRKIGDIHIPAVFLGPMREAPGILINAPFEKRVAMIVREYAAGLDGARVLEIVKTMENRIGKRNTDMLADLFRRGELEEFVSVLLEKYYDPLYEHSLAGMRIVAEVNNLDADAAATEVAGIINELAARDIK
jgi:tRNA 2-selenouridine synthase